MENKMLSKVLTNLNIFLFLLSSSPSYGYDVADIDAVIENYLNKTGTPGVYFSFVNGFEMLSKGYGLSDVDSQRPADDRTRVFIASLSKVQRSISKMYGIVNIDIFTFIEHNCPHRM